MIHINIYVVFFLKVGRKYGTFINLHLCIVFSNSKLRISNNDNICLTGIFPLKKDALHWTINQPDSSVPCVSNERTDSLPCGHTVPCPTCFLFIAKQQNVLVQTGVVDEALFDVCVPNILPKHEFSSNRAQNLWSTSQHHTLQVHIKHKFSYLSIRYENPDQLCNTKTP